MSNSIKDLKELIVLSINCRPTNDLDDLMQRDFLKNKSRYGIEILLHDLRRNKHLYKKGAKLYAYKKSEFLRDSE